MRVPQWLRTFILIPSSLVPPLEKSLEALFERMDERHGRDSALAKLLDFDDREWRSDSSPAALLRADFGVVPFHGRIAELGSLAEWCSTDEPLRLRLFTAPGGFGKTRLLRHFVRMRREHGWGGGFLREGTLDEGGIEVLFGDAGKPLLLVLDYAESRRGEVEAVVRAARASGRKVRVVLLARSDGDWWTELLRAGDGVGDFFQGPAVDPPIRLAPLTDSPELRRESYEKAVHAFAGTLKQAVRGITAPPLDDEDYERVLLIHASALAAVEGARVPSARLLDWLLERERRGIERVRERMMGAGPELQRGVEHAAALVTLAAGADSLAEVVSIIARVPTLSDQPRARLDRIAEGLHVLYRGRRWCDGVEPDLVGEHLVSASLKDALALLQAAFGEDVPEATAEAGLTVLNRLAARGGEGGKLLEGAIEYAPEHTARAAVRVAITGGDPIGVTLANLLRRNESLAVARQLDGHIPYPTTVLREVGAEVDHILLADLRASGDSRDEETRFAAAGRARDLSVRLFDLGRREEALDAIREAVEIDRDLAAARPHAFRPSLARSLNNYSNCLAGVGRHEEALSATREALEIRRDLAASQLEGFRSELAISLNNLSEGLARLGRREEALDAIRQAVEIRRDLAAARPDAYRPSLANSLNNLSNRLAGLGRREEAVDAIRDAVEIYRDLAAVRPDAFRSDLALGLNNLSVHLAKFAKREEAFEAVREAVEIHRELVDARPDAFRPDLANSLTNLSSCLGDLGRRGEALDTIRDAVDIWRGLAAARPDAFRPDLAGSLNNLSNRLSDLGRRENALAAIQEAVAVYRDLAAARPDAFRPDLATSLNNLSVQLSGLGRREDALAAIQEAVVIYRDLAAARPDAFGVELARSVSVLHDRLRESGDLPGALAATNEALDVLEPHFRRHPAAFARLMGAIANDCERTAEELGIEPDRPRLQAIREILATVGDAD